MNEYYKSHQKLQIIGEKGQQQFDKAKVLVIGAGGLGCPCLQALAGCGIGTLGIADFDTIGLSNLHRQGLYKYEDIGKQKVLMAADNLRKQNPFINIVAHPLMVAQQNILQLIADYDIIVDCTDNFQVRYLINDACIFLNKPLVYGAIYQTEGHFTVFNYKGSATLRCLFPEPPLNNAIQSCAEIGAYNITTYQIGALMANEVVKLLLQNDQIASNQLICFDTLAVSITKILYSENPDSRTDSKNRFLNEFLITALTPDEILQNFSRKSFKLIDVRSEEERNRFNIGGEWHPLSELLKSNENLFLNTDNVIFYCQKGIRSASAVNFYSKKGFINCYSLKNGLNWSLTELDSLKNLS